MNTRPEPTNVGVANGHWGEEVAVAYLKRNGFEILDRNTRPVAKDRRLEIDIVTWDRLSDAIVFVEVKQHTTVSTYARRLRSITREKQQNLRRACNAWRRINRWQGAYRFDVVEIYGTPQGGKPIVDYIRNVRLFPHRERFVQWY